MGARHVGAVKCEGGVNVEDWQDKAKQNIAKWGVQDAKTLICLLKIKGESDE